MENCPPEAILRLIGTEAIGTATFAALEEHVERCLDCQKILQAAAQAVPQATRPAPPWSTPPTLPGLVIERALGRGGTSLVYLAWEPALKRHVAVKLFPKNSLVDPHAREHWLGEARALSRVPHDHVVTIHRVEETEEWLCLVLEYVPGGTLRDRLSEPLPPRDAARLTEIIARAVGYFHTRGVSHLDLKPSNILLAGEPETPWDIVSPKVSDFGIARLEGEPGATQTGANGPKGTPSYMAPEQVAALPGTIGPAADLHALGALLYHLLTGRPPYQGASAAETLDQVRNQEPASPRRLNGRIPRDLETICLTCLEKAPNRRYRTAQALADDLRRWLEGRPIQARRVSPLGHAWRWCRRHPAVAGLLATLALTLATGLIGLFVLLNQTEAERKRLAEARRRAEAYEQFSASTADQLAVFLKRSVRGRANTTREEMTTALLQIRDSIRDLRNRDILPSATIGMLELEIAWALLAQVRIDEARDLLKQAIADLEHSLAKDPKDRETRYYLGDALDLYGRLAEEAGQFEVALNCFEQVVSNGRAIDEKQGKFELFTHLYGRLQVLAGRLGAPDQAARKERLQHLNRQILGELLGSSLDPAMNASAPDLETIGELIRRYSANLPSSQNKPVTGDLRERLLSEWLALSVAPLAPFRSASSAAKFDRDPETESIALIAAAQERCRRLGLENSLVPATIHMVIDGGYAEAAEKRKYRRLDEARAIAGRMMPIARRLVQAYPDNAHSYRVLSEAYNQIKKNAIQMDDERLEEEAIVSAIAADQRALALEPYWIETRRHLEVLSEQLADLRAKKKAAGPSTPNP
jgi:tRNA A-37 threonylcarbamoyl transferase component Bud32/tetratricopeptide (TPR) repeat protein